MENKSSSVHVSNDKGNSTIKQHEIVSTGIPEIDNGEYWPLSGKPYVDMILTKTSVMSPYNLYLPKKMYKLLPSAGASAVLTYGRKKWNVFYGGAKYYHRFRNTEWRKFVDDNNLKKGNGLLFELSECSANKIDLKVLILNGKFPVELLPKDEDKEGAKSDNPIILG